MSYLSRFFRPKAAPAEQAKPDTSAMENTLRAAKLENALAVTHFTEATQRQELAAKFARNVISQVLTRADNIKASRDASIKK